MAVQIKQVRQQIKTLDPIKYVDGDLNVTYYKNAYTPRLEEEMEDAKFTTAGATLISMILPLVHEWDLQNGYDVYQYVRTEVLELVEQELDVDVVQPGTELAPVALVKIKRLFVINGLGGKLGEWEEVVVRKERIESKNREVLYKLEPVFVSGEQAVELRVVPVTHQGLLDVPLNLMTDVIKAVGEALSPGEAKNSNSEGSFS